jgi:hypothetical protein
MQPSEKRLLLILCAAVFLALNLLAFRTFLNSRKRIAGEIAATKSTLAEDKGWLDVGEALRPAETWIKTHPMPAMPADEASATLLKTEREAAEKAGLKVTEENLLPGADGPLGSTVGVSVKLSGPFAGVVRFLHAIQGPSSWRVIQKLALRSDTQPPNVLADLEILQYFRVPATAAATTPAPSGTP